MAKLDIRSLSIGNWVYDSKLDRCIVCSIEGIGELYAHLDNYDKPSDGGFEAECDIYPIPLTEEILLVNGYGEDKDAGFKRYQSKDGRILVSGDPNYKNTDNTWWVHIDNEDMESIGGLEISYLHEFQNLLRLSGINENVKLPKTTEKQVNIKTYIERLKEEQQPNVDTELAHCNADGILCDLLKELGYADVVEEYKKVGKWYA